MAAACGDGGGGGAIAFETIENADLSGIELSEPQVFTIATDGEWEEFWQRHRAHDTPRPALPAVDFSREMVIAAVDRQEPSGGYRWEISGIEESGGELLVRVIKGVPGDGCILPTVITQPHHIVRLARSDLEPKLVVSEETFECD